MSDSEGTERTESSEAGTTDDLDLTDEQADSVQGGATHGEIVITKPIDKPTP